MNTLRGSHAIFNLKYIKTAILPIEFGRLYNQLQTMREKSDYNCAYDISPDELKEHPKTGTGHPEPLKGKPERQITKKQRLAYRIYEEEVVVLILTAYGHYDDK